MTKESKTTKKIDKIGGRKKFDKFVGPTELWQKIEMDDREKKKLNYLTINRRE